ncbi:LOW QUALITY PROTEIN: adenosine deaminase 2-like [Penaeus chinensis]|uniref:LOW QUALITY PROTEIN: adenosine deaminase 2-like n=1 Tax=Penaeus chinensis TaxID=139456 RepID=UPI001FB64ED5|nr:LOW QUALITY PROTEIN: adenosine deaminase 2-like [Penaeus chinensis]
MYLAGVLLLWACVAAHALDNETYWGERERILAQEQVAILGQDQVLTAEEQVVNSLLMKAKMLEMDTGFESLNFLPAQNFLAVREQIEASDVFQMVRMMPKGVALHLHDTTLASVAWVVEELTYWENLYMCYTSEGQLLTKFMANPDASCDWQLVSEVRATYPSDDEFDQELVEKFSIITANPEEKYPDINSVWQAFEHGLIAMTDMVMYRPAWEAYLYRVLQEFADDNVLAIEFRGTLPPLYEIDGTELTPADSVAVYRNVSQRFIADHGDEFFSVRFIYAPTRHVDVATVWNYVTIARELRSKFPDFVAGFDLVGQEDLGLPLKDFLEPLLSLAEGEVHVPVFYHAGETAWMGMSTDENLIDALMLNASRIGHGYAISKHPQAKRMAREKDVAIEVCPVSNQVLMLVPDLRNHPVASLVAEGFPMVVSADDPATWGAQGLSYDFYEAFMALGGAKADLRFLKQLAVNSIKYSSLDEDHKANLMLMWQTKWDQFISTVNRLYHKNSKKFYPNHAVHTLV